MKGHPIDWQLKELVWLRARAAEPRRALFKAFCAQFSRTEIPFTTFKVMCIREGILTGRTGCFSSGHAAPNKGKKMPYNAASAATQFKKGMEPHNTKYLGHERINCDGYVEVSVAETNPHTGYHRRYVHKHIHSWTALHGPVPKGMCLKCLDGDRSNCDPSNWECIPNAMLPRLNGRFGRRYETAEAEVKPVIMTIAKLEHAVREVRKGKRAGGHECKL